MGCAYNSETDITIGELLDQFFGDGLLSRPDSTDKDSWTKLLYSTIQIVENLCRVGMFTRISSEEVEEWWDSGKIMSRTISSLFETRSTRSSLRAEFPSHDGFDVEHISADSTLDVNDLDINSLQRVGKLRIAWTLSHRDHLKLRQIGGVKTLFIS